MRVFSAIVLVLVLFMVAGVTLTVCGLVGGAVDNGAKVIQKEFYPDALLRKYEWFKDASAALDAKQADMKVYDVRLKSLNESYQGVNRRQWPRDDREQYSIWLSEAAGIRASYNQLASEYNSEMVKWNKSFMNTGKMPDGGKPLPREYRTYQEE